MNRAERRDFFRRARIAGVPKGYAQMYYDIIDANERLPTEITDGMKVKINVDQIVNGKNYYRMLDEYKEFVESSRDKVFTAYKEDRFIRLDGGGKWRFWAGDLIICEEPSDE